MAYSKKHALKLGVLVSSGLLLFILAIYVLGSKQRLFTQKIIVKSYVADAAGLVEGNNVRYSGVVVGTVSEVNIVSDTSVLVVMSVDQKVQEYIHKDSKVEIGREGLLGNKILYILPGTESSGTIEEDDVLESVKALDIDVLLSDGAKVIENARIVSENLIDITDKMNNGQGDLAMLLNNDFVRKQISEMGNDFKTVSENANDLIQKIYAGDGDLWRLVNDTLITSNAVELLDNIDRLTYQADSLMFELRDFGYELSYGEGIVPTLVNDSTMIQGVDTTLINLNNSLYEIEMAAKSIRESWIINLFSGRRKK